MKNMFCIVTAGPTYEPIDSVRRITNFSTGRLGSRLAVYLATQGHRVKLLRGAMATFRLEASEAKLLDEIIEFTTSDDLREKLASLSVLAINAIFHAAAVCDFRPSKVYIPSMDSYSREVGVGKIPTAKGGISIEMEPTPKIIANLRGWFNKAFIVGWKYEVMGDQRSAINAGVSQVKSYSTNACIVNGPAYGIGYGLVTGNGACVHLPGEQELFECLGRLFCETSGSRG